MIPRRREAMSPVNLDADTQKNRPRIATAHPGLNWFSRDSQQVLHFSPLQNPLLSFVDQHQALHFAASRPASRPFTRQSITAQAPMRTAP